MNHRGQFARLARDPATPMVHVRLKQCDWNRINVLCCGYFFMLILLVCYVLRGRIWGKKKTNKENEKAQNTERISREKCTNFRKIYIKNCTALKHKQ